MFSIIPTKVPRECPVTGMCNPAAEAMLSIYDPPQTGFE
jgi:hypothetical protein